MVITRTPFRVSFLGGGTDYPSWYEKTGNGAVLSTSINKYCYVSCRYLPPFFKYKHRIVYAKQEYVNNIQEINHPKVKEAFNLLKPDKGFEIHYVGDLPARSGIGSSSSFTVGLLNALYSIQGEVKTKMELAKIAIHLEQNMVKENVGSQDQVAAAFGGLNKIDFAKNNNIKVTPVIMTKDRTKKLEDHLMLFFTDFARDSSKIAKDWIKNTDRNEGKLKTILEMVDEGVKILGNRNRNLDDFGKLLNEHWELKRKLANSITSSKIDSIYNIGLKAGALGGKLLGAGAGGFILFFAKPEVQRKVKEKLKNLLYVPFKFDYSGTQLIYFKSSDY